MIIEFNPFYYFHLPAPCPANYCSNGGTCYQPDLSVEQYACDCLANYRGDTCQEGRTLNVKASFQGWPRVQSFIN